MLNWDNDLFLRFDGIVDKEKKSFVTLTKVERFDPVQRPVVAELLRDDRFLG